MKIKKIQIIVICVSLLLFTTAELKQVRAYECISPARQNCSHCHTRVDIHTYHWTELGLTDPSECLLCHCGDDATSPCEDVAYGPVETVCCTTCHEKCAAVDGHSDIDQETPCLECHGDCTATSTIPVRYMHDSMCRKCHATGTLHAQAGHDDCAQCHRGSVPDAGNVDAANCTVRCHPLGRPGTCNLVNDHDVVLETLCRNCHQQCPLTTTTTTSMPDCDIMINPPIETVYSEQEVQFSAETTGVGCLDAVYQWGLNTSINSSIDSDGRYTAGFNDTGQPVTDIIVIEDAANQIILEWPIVVRFEKITAVVPGTLRRSPLFILPQVVMIEGEGTHFNDQSTVVMLYPPASVIPSWQTVVTENLMVSFLLVMPSWYSGKSDEQAMLMVMTGDEIVTKQVFIDQFPLEQGDAD